MFVYFIQSQSSGNIKIGWAINPRKRLRQLQCANSERLKLIGWISGSREREARLHWRFAEFHLRGEWFSPDPTLLDFIALKTESSKSLPSAKALKASKIQDDQIETPAFEPPPKIDKRKGRRGFLFFMSHTLISKIKLAAWREDTSMSKLIRQSIRKYLKELLPPEQSPLRIAR